MSDEHPGPEARVFRRTGLSIRVKIEVEGIGEATPSARVLDGRIVDVGRGGMQVQLDEGVPEGTLCRVHFAGPELGEQEVRGFVRRSRVEEGVFYVGIEFEAPIEVFRAPSDEEPLDVFDLEAIKILVVDDEPGVVELLYRFLTSRGCEVSIAKSGEEALKLLRKEAPDITVLDLKMPGMGGLEVLETIREAHLDAGKVWAVSGYATDSEAREALRCGAADFINKPLDLKYLEWSMQLHLASA